MENRNVISPVLQKLQSFFIFLYVFLCLFLPSKDFFINKKIVFILCIVTSVIYYLISSSITFKKDVLIRAGIILLIPIVYLPICFFNTYNLSDSVFLVTSCSCILLFVAINIIDSKIIFKSLLICGYMMSILTILISILPIVSKPISTMVNIALVYLETCDFGKRDFNGLNLSMIHFRTVAFMIIPTSYHFFKFCRSKKRVEPFISFGLHLVAIVLSASRGVMLFTFLSIYCICLVNISETRFRRIAILLTMMMLLGLPYLLTKTLVFDFKETSNSVKLGHVESFNRLIDDKPSILLTGQGTASQYYSEGFHKMTWQTEVTFLDMLRYWGIVGTVIYLINIMIPNLKRAKFEYSIPFIFYFLNGTTNPLYFQSTGMLVIVIYFFNNNSWYEMKSFNEKDSHHKLKSYVFKLKG